MAKTLTKEMLIQYGVSNVSEDGRVMINGHYVKTHQIGVNHKYGQPKMYCAISYTDKTRFYNYKGKKMYYRTSLSLARVVLAWFNGSIDGNMDADHINNDPFDNRLSNLRAISRKENLERRAKTQKEITREYLRLKKLLENKEN